MSYQVEYSKAVLRDLDRVWTENTFTGYYFVVYKAYLAFCRLEKETMLADRVLFGKSDYRYIRMLHLT